MVYSMISYSRQEDIYFVPVVCILVVLPCVTRVLLGFDS